MRIRPCVILSERIAAPTFVILSERVARVEGSRFSEAHKTPIARRKAKAFASRFRVDNASTHLHHAPTYPRVTVRLNLHPPPSPMIQKSRFLRNVRALSALTPLRWSRSRYSFLYLNSSLSRYQQSSNESAANKLYLMPDLFSRNHLFARYATILARSSLCIDRRSPFVFPLNDLFLRLR